MVHQRVKYSFLFSFLFGFLIPFVTIQKAIAQTPSFQVSEVVVNGNRKVEKDAILEKIKVKAGERYESTRAREDIENIFSLGYFQYVDISTDSSHKLIIDVVEKPSISEIEFIGNDEQKKEDVAEASGLKTYEIYNANKVKEAVEKIRKFYEDKGFLLAKIDVRTEEVKKDENVKIIFNIVENEKVKVKKITFLGNEKLKDSYLKGRIATQEMGYFTGISNSGAYKQDAFERDILILRSLYWNQGYIKVNIDRPQVYVTPDKTSLYITFRIEEGEQYAVGDIDFSGELLFSKDELLQTIQIKDSKIFAIDVMQKDILDLQAKYGDLGYAFANVNPKYTFDEREKKVNLVFDFEKGNKVYFGRINVVGNIKTRDKVVRRELKITEGELYHETRKRQSQENVQRLGYFDELNFKTSVSPDNPDILNVDIAVKERSTGQIQFGAGYGTSAGFTLTGSVTQSNFLGKGQTMSASLDLSEERRVYSFRFTEPYFRDTLWTVGFDVYSSANTGRVNYDVNRVGSSILFGHPLGEFVKGYFKYRYDKTSLKKNDDTDPDLFPLETASGETSSGTFILEYDTRNDRFSPSKGIFSDISYEYAGLGGQLKFSELRLRGQYYRPLFWDVIWRNSIKYSQLQTLVEGREVPFSELYLMGGPYSLRGYTTSNIGKRRYSNKIRAELEKRYPGSPLNEKLANTPFGGTKELIYQTELLYPLIKEAGVMGVVFYDIGQAEDHIVGNKFASDVGMGIRWFSPLGPLRFEWGWPLNRDPDYHSEPVVFEFSIGSPF